MSHFEIYGNTLSMIHEKKVKGVLFDMDGIIIDTERLYTRFWMEAANSLGIPMKLEHALGIRATNHADAEAKLKTWFGPETSHKAIRDRRIEMMEAYIEENGVELKPGIYELMEYLKAHGIKTAIATSSPVDRVEKHLAGKNLYEKFDEIVTAYMVKKGKPEPDIYILAAEKLGLKPEECIALEDSPSGITSAYRAGCRTIMIPDQDEPTDEIRKMLFAKADRLDDVIGVIEELKN